MAASAAEGRIVVKTGSAEMQCAILTFCCTLRRIIAFRLGEDGCGIAES